MLPDSWLSGGRRGLLAVGPGVNVVLSAVMERPCRGQDFPGETKLHSIVETRFEVVGRHPTGDVSKGSWRCAPQPECLRMENGKGWKSN